MVEWRRHLHSHPELSFHEVETAKYIKSILETYPNLEISSLTETSVIAVLKGSKPGKTIAFRADIDALPVYEQTDIDFRSKIVGMISVSEYSITASSDSATIVVKGKGSHSSSLELSIDPILIGVEIINNINHIVSRNVSPFDNLVISVGEFNSVKTANVIPDTARIQL